MRRDVDGKAFAEALRDTANILRRGQPLTPGGIDLYWRVLERFELEDVLRALSRHLQDPDVGQFMPAPADLVRQIEGDGDSRAMLAWTRAIEAVTSACGTYNTAVFDDWRIHAVITDMGGWIRFGEMTEDERPFRAREFEKRYRGYMRQAKAPYPSKLVGREEAHATKQGHQPPSPILLGDPARARLVMERGMQDQPRLARTAYHALPAFTRTEMEEVE